MFAARLFLVVGVTLFSCLMTSGQCGADGTNPENAIAPFAGKVTGSRVRLRVQPDLGSPVVDLLEEGSYLMVVAQTGDFYGVAPVAGKKAYVYRPYVLDGRIEGSHVNVRLEPDVDAPVIAQLNTGDQVQGEVCATNPRWMVIAMPAEARFYVAKEYLVNVGGPELVTQRQQRQEEVTDRLQKAYLAGQALLNGVGEATELATVEAQFASIRTEYPDFPEHGDRADAVFQMVQQLHAEQLLAQSNAQESGDELPRSELRLPALDALALGTSPERHQPLESASDLECLNPLALVTPAVERQFVTDKMLAWEPAEERLFEVWAMRHEGADHDAYYAEQGLDAINLTGIVELYDRPVQNRPGDFLLVKNNRPIAFLYSTRVNLEQKVGQQVTVRGLLRPNHHFAFPAYFVLSMES
jgi:hypothetical protein